MKLSKIKELATKELKNIKKHATEIEIDRLKFMLTDLEGNHSERCVYGIMTHNCFSNRANILIEKCASKYKVTHNNFDKIANLDLDLENIEFIEHKSRKNATIYFSHVEILLLKDKNYIQTKIKEIFN